MNAVAAFVGWFCLAMLGLAIACAAVAGAAAALTALLDRYKRLVAREERADIGLEIRNSAHWFSEDPAAMEALRITGERLRDGLIFDPDQVRQLWRQKAARGIHAELDAMTEHMKTIRYAGNDAHPTAIWMQKVAAHAMEPNKWPHPGPQSKVPS